MKLMKRRNTYGNTSTLKNLCECDDLYLQTDVVLLTDVFQNFRTACLEYYGLDPGH